MLRRIQTFRRQFVVAKRPEQFRDDDVRLFTLLWVPLPHVRGDDVNFVFPVLFLLRQQGHDGVGVLLHGVHVDLATRQLSSLQGRTD